jgi:putative hemolysin
MQAEELSQGSRERPGRLRQFFLQRLERLSGVHKYLHVYEQWRTQVAGRHPQMMNELLRMLEVELAIQSDQWPPRNIADGPLVMVANHPFGIGDGIALAAMAEQLQRPFKVLINTEFLRIPEFHGHCLPIDFSNNRDALATNLATRKQALEDLRNGVTLLAFPAGTVATAPRVFGRAQEVPWKMFTAGLVQKARANVLPVFFEGQNSFLFHAASHVSASARMSLLIAEFRRFPHSRLNIHAGAVVSFADLDAGGGRLALTDDLYLRVHRLAPWAMGKTNFEMLPPEWMRKAPHKWDLPLGQADLK